MTDCGQCGEVVNVLLYQLEDVGVAETDEDGKAIFIYVRAPTFCPHCQDQGIWTGRRPAGPND
jgi:hypothetical protein